MTFYHICSNTFAVRTRACTNIICIGQNKTCQLVSSDMFAPLDCLLRGPCPGHLFGMHRGRYSDFYDNSDVGFFLVPSSLEWPLKLEWRLINSQGTTTVNCDPRFVEVSVSTRSKSFTSHSQLGTRCKQGSLAVSSPEWKTGKTL